MKCSWLWKIRLLKVGPVKDLNAWKDLIEYWNYHDELSILDGLILKGTCIVIPSQCREELLAQLHEGHFGIDWGPNLEPMTLCIGLESTRILRILLKLVIHAKKMPKEIIKIQCYQGKFPCHCGQLLKWICSQWMVIHSC